VGDLFPLCRVWILHVENRNIVFAQVVHHAEELAIRRKPDLVSRRMDLSKTTSQ
jgi:hypothetical protein